MGIFSKLFGMNSSNKGLKDFEAQEKTTNAYEELMVELADKYVDEFNFDYSILAKYSKKKKKKKDIDQELLEKYMKNAQDELNRIALDNQLEKAQMDQEVDSLDGANKDTKDQVKKTLEEEQKEKGKLTKGDKEELKKKVLETTYGVMQKELKNKGMDVKNAQFESMALGLTEEEAMQMIAIEKNMDNVRLKYHKQTGKDIQNEQKIKQRDKERESEFNYTQRGIEHNTDDRLSKLKMLYLKREEEHEKYIQALMDPNKSSSEIALYKKDYQDASMELYNKIPSIEKYSKELNEQKKVDQKVNDTRTVKDRKENVSMASKGADGVKNIEDTATSQRLDKVAHEKEVKIAHSQEMSQKATKEAIDSGDVDKAEKLIEADATKSTIEEAQYDEAQKGKDPNAHETKKAVDKDIERQPYNSFRDSLRSGVEDPVSAEENGKDNENPEYKKEELQKAAQDAKVRTLYNNKKNNNHS